MFGYGDWRALLGPHIVSNIITFPVRSKKYSRDFLQTDILHHIALWVSSALEKYPDEMLFVSEWINAEINPRMMPLVETL